MIAKFFQWAFKASIYAGIGAAAVYYYPIYSKSGFCEEAQAYLEGFISERTVQDVAEIEVLPPAIRVTTASEIELVENVTATGTVKKHVMLHWLVLMFRASKCSKSNLTWAIL